MRTKHFLFVLLTVLCLVTAWAQPFDADIRQTADYKQAQTWVPVLLRDNAASYRRSLGVTTNIFLENVLSFDTNGQVVANTGTNQLTFTNGFSIRDAFSGSNLDFVFTDESLGAGYGDSDFAIGVGAYGFAVKYSSSGDWGQPILVTEGSGVVRFPSSTIDFIQPLAWNNASNAATTRANLGFSTNLNTLWTATNASNARSAVGLGATNNVTFDALHVERDASNVDYTLTIGTTNTGFKGLGGGATDFVLARDGAHYLGILATGLDSYVTHKFYAPLSLQYGAGSTAVLQFSGVNAATGAAISRTNLGLGDGITTNRTFVSYNGTNYTTNSVTISNGIITGWTQ